MTRALLLTLLLANTSAAHAATSLRIPLQGTLTNLAGDPIAGDLDVRFALYASEASGEPLWSETTTVTFANGSFAIFLGSSTELTPDLFATNPSLYLSMQIEDDDAFERFELGTVPYSAHARNAETATLLEGLTLSEVKQSIEPSDLPFDVCEEQELSAHKSSSDHDGRYSPATVLADTNGTLNASANPLDWSQLKSVPSGFADGTDAVDGGTASDVSCTGCVGTTHLDFDPATQTELAVHASSDDHSATYLNIDGDTMTGLLTASAGIDLHTSGSRPTCDASNRGRFWFTESASGTQDIVQACIKNAADTYEWKDAVLDPRSCPTGSTRVGIWCIEDDVRGPHSSWIAQDACNDLGKTMCPVEALFACDVQEPADSDCTIRTDEDTIMAGTPMGLQGGRVDNLMCYWGSSDESDVLDPCSPYFSTRSYFCCSIAQ